MNDPNLVIQTNNLCKSYSRGWFRRRSLKALDNVAISVARGEVFALLGPNGAGKTTLIKLLLGILRPTSGNATVLQQPAGSLAARMKIGYLPENLVFPKHLTGIGALYFYGRLSRLTESKMKATIPGLLDLVGLSDRETESVRKYSKGMRQRLGLAQALLHKPEILVLDEPTDGLDPLGRSQIRDLIDTLKSQGKTIFLNSHILQEVELICDRVAIMAKGKLRTIGTIPELIESHSHGKRLRVHLKCRAVDPQALATISMWTFDDSLLTVEQSPCPHSSGESTTMPIDFAIQLETSEQIHIDHLIDRLRMANVSLLSLERHRIRLEDVFMTLVDQ
ncbi:MAG: ABC transporter ATP-binding protein [Planctomycetota bacterium]|nr:ABC transporter ATP-binding protein [Planctomycetota bacterium]